MSMAQYVYGDAAREIHQFAARLIPHTGTCTAHGDEPGWRVVGDHNLVEIGTLHRSLLNGHRSLLKRNACLELAGDGRIVRTDFTAALPPSDNLLQRKTSFFRGFRQCDK